MGCGQVLTAAGAGAALGAPPPPARLRMYSSKESPEAMAPFLPRELFSADTGVGSLEWALGVPPHAAS
jgi:hypothetical protein